VVVIEDNLDVVLGAMKSEQIEEEQEDRGELRMC
jgi:hypothetical protein